MNNLIKSVFSIVTILFAINTVSAQSPILIVKEKSVFLKQENKVEQKLFFSSLDKEDLEEENFGKIVLSKNKQLLFVQFDFYATNDLLLKCDLSNGHCTNFCPSLDFELIDSRGEEIIALSYSKVTASDGRATHVKTIDFDENVLHEFGIVNSFEEFLSASNRP